MILPVTNYGSPYDLSGGLSPWATSGATDGFSSSLNDSTYGNTQVTLSALGQLQAASDAFVNALALLMPPDQTGSSTASSSNPSAVTVTAQSNAAPGTYNLTVNSLAQGQTLQSASFATADTTVIGSGQLTITLGSYDSGSNTFTPGSQAPSTVSLNGATPNDVAAAINAAGAGVTAEVQPVSGGYALVISGSGTGTQQGFEIQVNDPSLSGLSFDPTNPQGSGLTQTQAAQGGSVSVNGATISTTSNTGVTIAPGLNVNLQQTGSSVVTSSLSSANAQSQAQELVSAFNAVQTGLAAASSASSGAAEDVASPFSSALVQAATASYSTGDSQISQLSQIGLNLQFGVGNSNAVGLSLDTGTLNSAMSTDPTGTQSLLNAVVQAFNGIASSYSGGGGVIDTTQSGYESAAYVDQLVQPQSLQPALPTVQQLATVQSGANAFAPAQIQNVQQYARSFGPFLQTAWTSMLLSELYTPYMAPFGLVSALA